MEQQPMYTSPFPPKRPVKTTWEYCEKSEKNTIYHKISVTKDRFTHQSENKNAKTSRKEKMDISLTNIHSVRTSYSHSRNVPLVVFLSIMAFIVLAGAVVTFLCKMPFLAIGIAAAAVALTVVTIKVYMKTKTSFVLEINTYGTITCDTLSYGHAHLSNTQSKKKRSSPLLVIALFAVSIAFMIPTVFTNYTPDNEFMSFIYRNRRNFQLILFADAVLSMIGHVIQTLKDNRKSAAGAKYKFEMTPEVGYDIVESIGSLIMDKE